MSRSLTIRGLREFLRDDRGATAIEYALIAAGVAGAIIAVVTSLGTTLNGMYTTVSNALN
ncbi:MAG TPA: Flp family type IVb pilin [Pseudolabrys sp.]|nr:Flp family type IVb pilin [Pseudolabrys sp.]